jgi:hypothetical protein
MSNAGTAIDAIQQELAKSEWDNETVERINRILIEQGYTEHISPNVFENRFLRAQLVSELNDHIRECLHFWEDSLGFDVEEFTTLGFATSIVVTLSDINALIDKDQS